MGGIRHRIHHWRVRKQQREFDRWHAMLNAMNGDELGAVIVIATSARHLLEREYGVDLLNPTVARDRTVDLIAGLNGCLKELQESGKQHQAASAKVWLHTFRCARTAELRSRGCLLWRTLQRGMPHAEDAARTLWKLGVEKLDITGFDQIPIGLESDRHGEISPHLFGERYQ